MDKDEEVRWNNPRSKESENTRLFLFRILVLSQGEIVEFDTPNNLLSDKKGIFYEMAKDFGLVT